MGQKNTVAGLAIKELRKLHRPPLSQAELASALKVATNTVCRWETGVYEPSLDDIWHLSDYFKVSVARFFPRNEEGDGCALNLVSAIRICDSCLDGAGGECHSPGCILWMNRGPDIPIRESILQYSGTIKPEG